MTEDEIIEFWTKELDLYKWSEELLGGQKISQGEPLDINLAKQSLPWTQVVTAEVIKNKIGSYLSYDARTKTWFAWNGIIHQPCTGEDIALVITKVYFRAFSEALSLVETTVDNLAQAKMVSEGIPETDKEVKIVLDTYTKGFQRQRSMREDLASTRGREQVVKAMRTEFKVPDDYFDHDRDYLVVRNCVIDLATLRETGMFGVLTHDPSRPVTRYLDINYEPNIPIEGSVFMKYLDDVLLDNEAKEETKRYLMKVMGAAFMGESRTRTVINVTGPPGSGKSNFIDLFMKLGMNGSSYSTAPDAISILKMSGTNFEQDQFRNKRFIAISEPSSFDQVDDEFLKRFTGEDFVMTRTLNAKSSGWSPQGLLFIASNSTLRINSRDEATVQRIKVIEFPYRFVDNPDPAKGEKQIDSDLSKKMLEEENRPAVLSWLLHGMLDYVADGRKLNPPQYIKDKQAKISKDASSTLRWIEEALREEKIVEEKNIPGDYQVQRSAYLDVNDAYRMYRIWCSESGEHKTLSKKLFEEDISKLYPTTLYDRKKLFKGLIQTNLYRNMQINKEEFDYSLTQGENL